MKLALFITTMFLIGVCVYQAYLIADQSGQIMDLEYDVQYYQLNCKGN